jgi:putative nucleotidyltransferase with HDIG domain
MREKFERLEKTVARVGDLPAMPEIVAEVVRLTEDPATTMAQLGDVLQHDQALTAKILRVSNSAYYGMKQHVGTLRLALVILGVREIRNVVLGISLFDALLDPAMDSSKYHQLWNHSLVVAALAKKLADHLRLDVHGEDFIAGLLHDIGKLVMWRRFADRYTSLVRAARPLPKSSCPMEEEKFGFNHAEVGAALLSRWNLPETLVDALLFHHPSDGTALENAKDPRLSAMTRIANFAARDPSTFSEAERCYAYKDDEAWRLMGADALPPDPAGRSAILAGFRAELEASNNIAL